MSARVDILATRPDGRTTRIRSIDGLRALAITAVVLYHYPITKHWVSGGWLGVDLFFVISGYLITEQLLQARGRPFPAAIRDFYRRRARRLLPALLVMVAVWLLLVMLAVCGLVSVWPVASPTTGDLGWIAVMLVATAGIAQNWVQALIPVDVALFSPRWSFGNLWSLCVEEQFYLLWPLLTRLRRSALAVLTAALGVASLLTPTLLHGAGGARLYFGTDSRCVALLAGAALAQTVHLVPRTDLVRRCILLVAVMSGVYLVLCAHVLHDAAPITMPFVYGEIAVASVVVLAACALFDPAGPLCWPPVQWLGRRSYAVYLWQGPFAAWFVPRGGLWWVCGVVGTLVAAELSWRLVESRWQGRRSVATR